MIMARKLNNRLRTENQELEYTEDNVAELLKCATDPVYFITNYVMVQHPTKGALPFKLYDYQKKMVNIFHTERYSVTLSARQTGKSVTSAAYLLWFAMFNRDKTVLIAANKNANAMEMILRIRYAYEELPFWLKPGVKDDGWNKHEIGFDNGSRIVSTATSADSGRGMAISLLFLDEFAFVKPTIQDEFWTSISPTLSTGGACIMTSTPNGDMNIYAQVWRAALAGTNGYKPIHVTWNEPPGRDEKFKEEEIGRIGTRRWSQEYECEFLSSDAQLIDSLFLANLSKELDGVEPLTNIRGVTFFERINPASTYLVGVDPSSGNGEDFSVIEVFEFPSLKQVAEYRSNTMSTKDLYDVLKNILLYLEDRADTVFFSIENNGVGNGLITLHEADEDPVTLAEFISEPGKEKLGFTTTAKSKMKNCVTFKEIIERGQMKTKSHTLLSEMKSYVRYKGAYAAQAGASDDCISACLIVIRILEEISQYEVAAYETLYSAEVQEWDAETWDGYDGGYDESEEGLPILL